MTGLGIAVGTDSWEESSGAVHVITIFLSKVLAHHLFFARRANKVHERKSQQSVSSGQPVFQKETLRQTPDPDGRIHWMPPKTTFHGWFFITSGWQKAPSLSPPQCFQACVEPTSVPHRLPNPQSRSYQSLAAYPQSIRPLCLSRIQ